MDGKKDVALLHEPVPFSVLFSFSASCYFCPHSTMSLSSENQGQGMDGPQRALSGTVFPNGGLTTPFLCVFQGSAGA